MKNLVFFVTFILLSLTSFGQLGYLGKRIGIEIGVTTNYSVIGNLGLFYDYTLDKDVLPPKLSFGLLRETKRGNIIHLTGTYNQLQNSQINSLRVEESPSVSFNEIDTIWTASDNWQFAIGLRKYRELAPLGLYFEFMVKGNLVSNKSLYRAEDRDEYVDLNYYESMVKFETVEKRVMIPEIGMSIGTTIPLNNVFALDVGGSFNLSFGRYRAKFGDITLDDNSDSLHKILSSKKIFTTNLLELYVKIILFP